MVGASERNTSLVDTEPEPFDQFENQIGKAAVETNAFFEAMECFSSTAKQRLARAVLGTVPTLLFIACGGRGEAGVQPKTVGELEATVARPPATATGKLQGPQIGMQSAEGQAEGREPEQKLSQEVPKIQPTVIVEELPSVTKKYLGEKFELSQAGLDIMFPGLVDTLRIPEGDRFTVAINLGNLRGEIAAIGNTRRDRIVGGQVKPDNLIPGYTESELYGIGIPEKGILTNMMQDIVNSILQMRGEPRPELDPSIKKFIEDAKLTLERGRDGSLTLSVDVLNRTVRDEEGNVVYSPDHFRLGFEGVEGLDPAQIEGSIYQEGKRIARIGKPAGVEQLAEKAPAAEPTDKPAAVEHTEKPRTVEPAKKPRPEPTAARPETGTERQGNLTGKPSVPGESREIKAEEIQPAFSKVFAQDTIVYSILENRMSVDAVSYDTAINLRIPKAWIKEGGGELTVEIGLEELAGARIGIDGYEEYGNLTIHIPEDPREIAHFEQTLNFPEAIAEIKQSLPNDELNSERDFLMRVAEEQGFRVAVRKYAEYLSEEHNAGNPDELEAAIVRNSGAKVVEKAIEFADRMAKEYVGQLPAEFRPRVEAALRSVQAGVREGDDIDAVISNVETRLLAEAAPYSGFVSGLEGGIRTKMNELRESLFVLAVPTVPNLHELPDHMPERLEIRDGKMYIPVNGQRRTIALAVDLPDDAGEAARLSGKVVGDENLRFSFDLRPEE